MLQEDEWQVEVAEIHQDDDVELSADGLTPLWDGYDSIRDRDLRRRWG
jgi:hypothetical protein